jgi:hypothetical protein
MKFVRLFLLLVPLVLVFLVGLIFNGIAQAAGAVDDGCAWLFDKMYHGK